MIKTNLIIDGNFMLYKNVFILKNNKLIREDLLEILMSDLKRLLKTHIYSNVYFISDTKENTWRKEIYPEYKGQRVKDKTIDWKIVWSIYEDFKEKIREYKDIKFLELPGLEADDFIGHIVNKKNKENYSNVIISSDIDINQFVKYDINNQYINLQWNFKMSNSIIYLPINYQLFLEHISNINIDDIDNITDNTDFIDFLENIIRNNKITLVNKEQIIFTKIVKGDRGDNIHSVLKSKAGKIDDTGRNLGDTGANKLYEMYKELYPEAININNNEFKNRLSNLICHYKKLEKNNENLLHIEKNIDFNKKLIVLSKQYMPIDIYNKMTKYFNNEDKKIKTGISINNDVNNNKIVIPDEFQKENNDNIFNSDDFFDL